MFHKPYPYFVHNFLRARVYIDAEQKTFDSYKNKNLMFHL